MALMIPDSLPPGASKGEESLYQILFDKLPNDFYVWYEPIRQSRLPYFTILAPEFGLLILEVVGWFSHQILSADSHYFTIQSQIEEVKRTEVQPPPVAIPGRRMRKRSRIIPEVQKSPLQQGYHYLNQLLNKLQPYQILCQSDRLAFPIGVGAVLSNITVNQAREKNIYPLLDEYQIIYREEFLLWNDIGQSNLVNRLKSLFANRFNFSPLTFDQIETIKGILYPEVVIKEIPASPHSVPDGLELRENSSVLRTLDYRQECIVKAIGKGHRIIYGVAGSGKTLILLCRAKLLINQNPTQRILILCFNVCLARYLKSILHDDTQNPQLTRIDVFNFYGWASSLVKNLPARLPGLPVDYCDELIGEKLLEKLSNLPSNQKWDAILVDEAQTFLPSWFKCCVAALKDSENGNLMVVADGNQHLYQRRDFTWKSVGIKAVGRTTSKKYQLDKNYRNTQEILDAAWSVINQIQNLEKTGNPDKTDKPEVKFPLVESRIAVRHGSVPVLHIQRTKNQEVEAVIQQIQNLYQIGYSPNEIAVLYRIAGADERRMLNYLVKQLEHLGIECYWVTESRSSERSYSVNSSGIRIMSTLNSLGLEFKVVLIVWVQDWECNIPAQFQTDAMTCRRLYVAMTRAQDKLYVFGSGNSRLLESLKQSQTFEIKHG